ncbi:cation diffusion facilitator family transporter [Trichlorobacter ammonificans]|uniref:Zinc transporter ZitB n=1 Tax=Trichlorobacter ammonificans TaxID=2916410 RepID=A0ABM9D7Z9_9BACT|nr:cation diffusion facilitator family transporter [Trichlorobacter ammonificans]CAH2031191.1 Zinc transporter ZitB [Trichlorobacter ammonificans]
MTALDQTISRRLIIAILLTGSTFAAEIVGGIWANSLALLSDAGHLFLDLFALLLSLGAIKLAAQPPTARHSFGWHRAEVLAAFLNGLTVLVMALVILYEGGKRMVAPEEVKTVPMLIIAVLGLLANLLAARGLHDHAHDDLNVKSAFLHVLGDAVASLGVIVGALVMLFTGWYQLDALISIAIGLLIMVGAWRVLRDAVHILMEGVPPGMSLEQVAQRIKEVEGVADLHHLNLWSVCSHIIALSVHVEVQPGHEEERGSLLHRIEQVLARDFHITHTTIQLECSSCNGGPLFKPMRHIRREHRHQ